MNTLELKGDWNNVNGKLKDDLKFAKGQDEELLGRRNEVLAASNRKLELEIVRRQSVEESLKKSELQQNQLLEQSRQMQEQLRALSHQILNAQEEERKRISHDLHDEIAQTLVGINLHLAQLTLGVANHTPNLSEQILRTQKQVEQSVAIVHQFARQLRPPALDNLGLMAALNSFIKEFTQRTAIPIRLTTFKSGSIEKLNIATRTVFYRVAQEALTNVARHAHATFVEVKFEKLPGAICLKITDNGKSFQVKRVLNPKRNKRLGLVGMRERLEMVGGSLSVQSAPGRGTTVRAEIPLSPFHPRTSVSLAAPKSDEGGSVEKDSAEKPAGYSLTARRGLGAANRLSLRSERWSNCR